ARHGLQMLHVGPGAEPAPGAGDDDRPDVLARGAILEQVEVQGLQLWCPCVEPFGPVQRQQCDVILDLPQHDLAHRSSSVETNTKRTPAISSGSGRGCPVAITISVRPRSESSRSKRMPGKSPITSCHRWATSSGSVTA